MTTSEIKLNLGSADDRRPGYLSVDIEPPADVVCDLREPWPWLDGAVHAIYAKDVAEHIGNGYKLDKWFRSDLVDRTYIDVLVDVNIVPFNGMIHFMNEAHRVLCHGGLLELIVPCWPGIAPFVDPTHGWPIWTQDTRYYFDERWNNKQGERGRLGPYYGITALFRTLPESRSGVDWNPVAYAADSPDRRKLFLLLQAVKR